MEDGMKKPLDVANDLQRVARGRLTGKRALNVLAKAVREVAGPSDFKWRDLDSRADCVANAARARRQVARVVRDYDKMPYNGHELLMDLRRLKHDSERRRIEGPRLSQEEIDHDNQRLLRHVGIIEAYVTRLLGVPCAVGQDALEKDYAHPAMLKPIVACRD